MSTFAFGMTEERNRLFRAEGIAKICYMDGARSTTTTRVLVLVLAVLSTISFVVPMQTFAFEQFDGDDGPAPVPLEVQVVITVSYDDDWIGSISEGGIGMSSVDGRDTEYILVTCDGEGILGNYFSASFSKSDDDDDLMTVTAIGLGVEVIDSGKTTAELGLVSIGGQCD